MITRIHKRGHSFKGVAQYLSHDKDKAKTSERIEWTHTDNIHTDDIEKSAKVMAFTDINADSLKREFGASSAGRKSTAGNVYHRSLSWSLGENPSNEHMLETAQAYIENDGLAEHQYFIIAHNDTDHKHLHIVSNLVHPETGKIHDVGLDKKRSQQWALEYEREYGLHCQNRIDNALKRSKGEPIKHQDQKQDYSDKVTRAYYASDNGKAFINALKEEGLELGKARRGNYNYVIVDEHGDIQKLSRQLQIDEKGKLKTEAIKTLLSDIDYDSIKGAEQLAYEIKNREKDKQDLEQENRPNTQSKFTKDSEHQEKTPDEVVETAEVWSREEETAERLRRENEIEQSRIDQTHADLLQEYEDRKTILIQSQNLRRDQHNYIFPQKRALAMEEFEKNLNSWRKQEDAKYVTSSGEVLEIKGTLKELIDRAACSLDKDKYKQRNHIQKNRQARLDSAIIRKRTSKRRLFENQYRDELQTIFAKDKEELQALAKELNLEQSNLDAVPTVKQQENQQTPEPDRQEKASTPTIDKLLQDQQARRERVQAELRADKTNGERTSNQNWRTWKQEQLEIFDRLFELSQSGNERSAPMQEFYNDMGLDLIANNKTPRSAVAPQVERQINSIINTEKKKEKSKRGRAFYSNLDTLRKLELTERINLAERIENPEEQKLAQDAIAQKQREIDYEESRRNQMMRERNAQPKERENRDPDRQ